jgi:hypothetical protein
MLVRRVAALQRRAHRGPRRFEGLRMPRSIGADRENGITGGGTSVKFHRRVRGRNPGSSLARPAAVESWVRADPAPRGWLVARGARRIRALRVRRAPRRADADRPWPAAPATFALEPAGACRAARSALHRWACIWGRAGVRSRAHALALSALAYVGAARGSVARGGGGACSQRRRNRPRSVVTSR